WQTRGVTVLLRLLFHRATSTRERGLRTLTRGRHPVAPPKDLRHRVSRHHLPEEGARPGVYVVDHVDPHQTDTGATPAAVVYFHGGAFVHGIRRQRWELVADLAGATGAPVYVPHYGRAPEHTAE